jgi:hypothetical protein
MTSKLLCAFEPRLDQDGRLLGGECKCGAKFYPYSVDPKDTDKALRYMEEQYREHWREKNGDPVL